MKKRQTIISIGVSSGCWRWPGLQNLTAADRDWDLLKAHFVIPEDMRHIDFAKIKTGSAVVATSPQTSQLHLDIQEEACDCY